MKLIITAPGGRKAEMDCEPSTTFGDVKVQLQKELGVPPEKQRLLCNGKERRDAAETLTAAGVTAKTKMMLMLAPGYSMPSPTGAGSAGPDSSQPSEAQPTREEEAEPVDLEGELPASGTGESSEQSPAVVHVRQGRHRYRIRVPQGLGAVTFGELADYLSSALLFPPGVPSQELRFITKGKTAERSDVLDSGKAKELSVMLLFREGFHLAAEGASWLRQRDEELKGAEAEVEKLGRRIEGNLCDAESLLRLGQVGGLVDSMLQSVESVRVREAALPEMARFRERVQALSKRLEVLRSSTRV